MSIHALNMAIIACSASKACSANQNPEPTSDFAEVNTKTVIDDPVDWAEIDAEMSVQFPEPELSLTQWQQQQLQQAIQSPANPYSNGMNNNPYAYDQYQHGMQ